MKMSLTLIADTDADAERLAKIAAQFSGAKSEPEKAPAKTEKAEKPAKTEKAEKPAKGKKAKEDTGPDINDVRKTFSKLIETLGDDDGPAAGKKLLKKYGAKQIPDLDAEHYAAIVEDAESLIAEAANTAEGDDDDSGDDDDLGIGDDGDDE